MAESIGSRNPSSVIGSAVVGEIFLSKLRYETACNKYIPRHSQLACCLYTVTIRDNTSRSCVFRYFRKIISPSSIIIFRNHCSAQVALAGSTSSSSPMLNNVSIGPGITPQAGFYYRGVWIPICVAFTSGQPKATLYVRKQKFKYVPFTYFHFVSVFCFPCGLLTSAFKIMTLF